MRRLNSLGAASPSPERVKTRLCRCMKKTGVATRQIHRPPSAEQVSVIHLKQQGPGEARGAPGGGDLRASLGCRGSRQPRGNMATAGPPLCTYASGVRHRRDLSRARAHRPPPRERASLGGRQNAIPRATPRHLLAMEEARVPARQNQRGRMRGAGAGGGRGGGA